MATDLLELLVIEGRLDEAAELAARGAIGAALLLERGDAAGAAAEAGRAADGARGPLERERWSLLVGRALAAAGKESDARVLSVKTVETHVRNVFAKLGVSSRVELAVLVERVDA